MDTSISDRDYVLKGYELPADRLPPEDWLAIVKETVSSLGGILKYFPYVKQDDHVLWTIRDWKLYDITEHQLRIQVAWALGSRSRPWVDVNARLIPIGLIFVSPAECRNAFEELETTLPDVYLFVTPKKEWVTMRRYITYSWEGIERLETLLFRSIDDDDLVTMIGTKYACWKGILTHLAVLAAKAAFQKRQHVDALDNAEKRISEKLGRIGGLSVSSA